MEKERLFNSNYLKVLAANFMLYFSFMLLAPLLPLYLSETFAADKQMIGFVLSGYTIAALVIRPISGYLVDTFPRKIVLLTCFFFFFALFAGYLVAGSITMFAIFRTLHGAPFGAGTVAASTVAIDVLPSSRRSEGIGYYGLSNNLATAIAPSCAIYLFSITQSYTLLFWIALIVSLFGLIINSTIRMPDKFKATMKNEINTAILSLDRFFLVKGWCVGITMMACAFSYGVISTYLAIYGKEELGITAGAGLFFALLSIGLILSRLQGGKALREGKVVHNASVGLAISLVGYFLFAALHNPIGYYGCAIVVGLGNGHMFPALQTMFINLAPNSKRGTANSTLLTSWDLGVGLGVVVGGILAECISYGAAFWAAWIMNLAGVAFYFAFVRNYFILNKLR